MKIAMLTSFFFPHRGGTEKYVLDLSQAQLNLGHEITIFTHTRGEEKDYNGIKVVRLPSIWIPYQPLFARKLKKELEEFDIIHSHAPPYFFNDTAVIPQGIPHITTYHCDVFIPGEIRGIKIPGILRKSLDSYYRKKAVKLLKRSSHIIATSRDYANSSSILKDLPYSEVPIGIHMEDYRISSFPGRMDEFDFLFVGRLAASKGIDILLKASAELASDKIPFSVRIIGDGEEVKGLKKMASELNIDDKIRFDGKVSQEELIKSLSAAGSLILPSVSRLEAFGIVQLEAFSCRTPVIASDLPGVRGLVSNSGGGWIVKPGDHHSLADAMRTVISDQAEARNRGGKGFNHICEHNCWEKIARQIEEIYLGEMFHSVDDHVKETLCHYEHNTNGSEILQSQ